MTSELQLLTRLKQSGYFERGDFDPQPVFQVCRLYLQLAVSTPAGSGLLEAMIRRMTAAGLVRLEYSPDPTLHPKDKLDYWRLLLTPSGATKVELHTLQNGPYRYA